MNSLTSLRGTVLAALFAVAPLAAQTADLGISAKLNPDSTLALKLTLAGPVDGTGYILLGTERSGPFPTPYGPLWIMPPTVAAIVPLGPTGVATLSFTVPVEAGWIAGALQAATANASGTIVTLSNFVLLGYSPPGNMLASEGGSLSYNGKTGEWGAGAVGPVGAEVEVWIIEKNHAILIGKGQIGRDGFCFLNNKLQPLLGKDAKLQLTVNHRVITTAR